MATATTTFTAAQLQAVLALATTDEVDFDWDDVPALTADALAQDYLQLIIDKNQTFEPFGRQLRRFANAKIAVVRAASVQPPVDPEDPIDP